MSNEEKKAIEYLKRHIMPYENEDGNIEFLINDVLLNLIEKQQKVIEQQQKEINFYKNEELGYIAGYEDGKRHKQTAVMIKKENAQQELFKKEIEKLNFENHMIKKWNEQLDKNCISKDKIRAKIEEITSYAYTSVEERECQTYARQVLKDLLEEN